MAHVDLLVPGRRVDVGDAGGDARRLAAAFNAMLERLEAERRESAGMALAVQEGERQRIARELHDEVGQTLTAMLLQIQSFYADAPAQLRGRLDELRETARSGAEDVRRIAQRLRPEALEELGLQSALVVLSDLFAEQTGVRVMRRIDPDLRLSAQDELVVYRVAQEALTNIARHAQATQAELELGRDGDGAVVLRVRDDGRGFDVAATPSVLWRPGHARARDADRREHPDRVDGGERHGGRAPGARERMTIDAGPTGHECAARRRPPALPSGPASGPGRASPTCAWSPRRPTEPRRSSGRSRPTPTCTSCCST